MLFSRDNDQQTSEALEDFLFSKKAARRSPRTIEYYQSKLSEFINWLPVEKVDAITAKHVRGFLSNISERDVADATLHSFARAVRAWLKFCAKEEYLENYPDFDMPTVEEKRQPVLSKDELRELLSACLNVRDRALLLFMADTGLRASELLSLDWGDVDLERGVVRVRRTKSRKWRSVVIGAKSSRALLRYRRTVPHAPDDPLWRSTRDSRLCYAGLRQVFRRLGERSGVEASPHDMRRLFATWSIREGMNLFAVQRILGHSSLKMVRRYAELVEDDLLREHREHGPVDGLLD